MRNLILIMGDQLSPNISSLKDADPERDHILMVEVMEEATYAKHHKKKIAFIFSAMRHFAEELRETGFTVRYVKLDAPKNTGSFNGELGRAIKDLSPEKIIVTEPSEYRVLSDVLTWEDRYSVPIDVREDTRFIANKDEFANWAAGRKALRMEYFYREMRRKTNLLIEDGKPVGGKWNYDSENRKPADNDMFMPSPLSFEPDEITRNVLSLVDKQFSDHFGDLDDFWFGATRQDAEKALNHFIETALENFGAYQDAMLIGQKYLYHSVLSLYLNVGLLDPIDICRRAQEAYYEGKAPLNSVEGFIRQIIGWREYIRGIYWLKMPDYEKSNFFDATRALPNFYWTGATDMRCMAEAIGQTKSDAYAHHIQRLMVTGNFALLIGANPHEIHEWYLAVYADAFEWVEMPNTIGMSQFADGGLLGSKPYISSGNYIAKMSNYCGSCKYNVKEKTGENACPFNALYWHFLDRNSDKLRSNPRLGPVYRTWDRMSDEKRKDYIKSANKFLNQL
ncbi:cryptochrome/photolyase family protein [Kordiimonas sp. SCSIO 12610]|uniref:cryptochrome/photolyase family protein n=1 Tax=Kordiimonas sp. SCSIO 12610 TaxID=2829597 RepID=UPI00351F64CA